MLLNSSGKEISFSIKEIVTFVNKLPTVVENNGANRTPLSKRKIREFLVNIEKTIPMNVALNYRKTNTRFHKSKSKLWIIAREQDEIITNGKKSDIHKFEFELIRCITEPLYMLGIKFEILDCSYPKWTGSQVTSYITEAIDDIIDHGNTVYNHNLKTDIWLRLIIYNDKSSATRSGTNKLISIIRKSLDKSGFSFKIKFADMSL